MKWTDDTESSLVVTEVPLTDTTWADKVITFFVMENLNELLQRTQ